MPCGFQALKNRSSPSLSLTRSVILSHSNHVNMSARRYTIDELKGLHQPKMPALAGPLPLAPWISMAQRPSYPPRRPKHRLTTCPKVDPKTDFFETFDNFDFEVDAGLSSLSIAMLLRWPPQPIHECHVTKLASSSPRPIIQPVPARNLRFEAGPHKLSFRRVFLPLARAKRRGIANWTCKVNGKRRETLHFKMI
ncbi:hypothetical protein QR685DRAFT_272528 [Neurospora intermedia]|uniref:Uncharacterized protein n=1 Tax=Neurospora intermedia TaxID=5142 RepID=A0ABR3DEE6_NEUIN